MFSRGLVVLCALASLFGCGPTVAPVETPSVAMEPEEARRIVADAERELATASDEWERPSDLDGVLRILQSDRIDLFPMGIEVATELGGVEGDALAAQLELSWSEGQALVAQVLRRAADEIDAELRSTSTRRGIGARRDRLDEEEARARNVVRRSRRLAEALDLVADDHLREGAQRTESLLESQPEHYLAFRLAADYYRMRERWDSFDESVRELEARRPDSTGLKFLRGAAAVQRGAPEDDAEQYLRSALEEDAQFTRAQVFVLVAQDTLPEIRDEVAALEEMSPHHQLVVWTKPLIEQGYLPFASE